MYSKFLIKWTSIFDIIEKLSKTLRHLNREDYLTGVRLCRQRALNTPRADWSVAMFNGVEDATNNKLSFIMNTISFSICYIT